MNRPFPPAQIRIRRLALAKLLLYADRCPVEIGGLGYVVWQGRDLLVSDLFILPQKVSVSDTELYPDALFALLERVTQANGDVASVRLWWHSHGDMDLLWSETDCATIENLPGDFWIAILVNRKGEVRCRLDAFVPGRETWELPLEEVSEREGVDLVALRSDIEQEILEQVQMCLVSEGASSEDARAKGSKPPWASGSDAVAARSEQDRSQFGK